MTVTERARTTAEAAAPALRDAADDVAESMRAAAGNASEVMRSVSGRAAETARSTAESARTRADQTIEQARGLGDRLPGILSRAIAVIAGAISVFADRGRAVTGEIEERGRTLAAAIDPPRSVRRRRRVRTAAWTAGGFGVGFAIGWLVHDRMHADDLVLDERWDAPEDGEDVPDVRPAAELIDARRDNGRTG